MGDSQLSEVSIEKLSPMRVACYRAVSENPEGDASKYLEAWYHQQNLSEPHRHFGFNVDVTPEQQKAGYRGYEVWVTVPEDVQASDGVTIRDFGGGLYATQTLYKPFVDAFLYIPPGWKKLHEWVTSSSQYRSGSHQWLEEMIFKEGGDDLKLYHPINPVG